MLRFTFIDEFTFTDKFTLIGKSYLIVILCNYYYAIELEFVKGIGVSTRDITHAVSFDLSYVRNRKF